MHVIMSIFVDKYLVPKLSVMNCRINNCTTHRINGGDLRRRHAGIAAMLLALLLLCAAPAQGQNKKQLEREKANIEKEITRLNNELSKAKKSTKNSTKQVNLLRQRIDERTRLINNINSQMALLDRQIVKTEDSLRVVRDEIDRMKAEYAKVVRSLYGLSFNLNPAGLLYDNETYNRSYLKMKYFKEYSRFRKHQATVIKRREQQFSDMALDLQRQINEQTTLLAQERKQKDALAREQQQQQRKLNDSKQQEKSLQKQIGKKEQQKRQLQQQIQNLIDAEVAKSAKGGGATTTGKGGKNTAVSTANDALSADFASNKGRMPWPVYYKSVAREFGIYTHPSGGQNKNNGIELVCTPGTQVYSVCSGTVSHIMDAPNGTKVVLMKHGAYITVYIGLGKVNVTQGTKVAARQVLGTVANGGEATSEFSFQVWRERTPLNPRQWLK